MIMIILGHILHVKTVERYITQNMNNDDDNNWDDDRKYYGCGNDDNDDDVICILPYLCVYVYLCVCVSIETGVNGIDIIS